jgi:hypothetical protein
MHHSTWPVGNSVILMLTGLRNRSGTYQNSAVVQLLSLKDRKGDSVVGITPPLTLTYVDASDGDYEVSIGPGVELEHQGRYFGLVRATVGGLTFEAEELIIAHTRRA